MSYICFTLLLPMAAIAAPPIRPIGTPDHVVDLSHLLVPGDVMPLFPVLRKYNFSIDHRGDYPGTKIYGEYNSISLSEHTGTHMDAPAHFALGKWRVQGIPIERCIANVVVIDIRDKAKKNRSAAVEIEDIQKWEKEHGPIPYGSYVFMDSGWSEKWGDKVDFMGSDSGKAGDMRYPAFLPDACKWLVDNRKIKGIGSDTLSVDLPQRKDIGCHVYVSARNVLIFENVANVNLLPPIGATIYAFPIFIHDGSGAPVRMVAMWNSATAASVTTILLIVGVVFSMIGK